MTERRASNGTPCVKTASVQPERNVLLGRLCHRSPHVVFVLEGSIWCGDRLCSAGTHIELPEGAAFGPFRAGPEGVTMFEVMMGDPRSWGDRPELVEALRAEDGVTELPDPEIDFPDWLEDLRGAWSPDGSMPG